MEEKRYFIPIIGAISAGKSTFLKAFLGINVLQTGETTTTRFICLIKNSKETLFYQIIPKKDKEIYFEKEGEEVKGEDNIKEKIEEINKSLSELNGTKDEIFYMLETPINNVDNIPLLELCYFMDVPGLNENKTSYIENIFSLISTDDILFEIVVFDSTSFQSDSILNIFRRLKERNCLKKQNNIFILNKIDFCKNEENTIDEFKQYFYTTFEDEKNYNNKDKILINIYENHFVPMNSLLLMAENRINDDFSSVLFFELFNYLECKNNVDISYFEFLQKRTDLLIKNFNLEIEDKIIDKDMIIIENSIKYLEKILVNIRTNSDFEFGINLNKVKVKKEIQKFYNIYKTKNYFFIHTKFYDQFQEIIKNIKIKPRDFSSPPAAFSPLCKNLIEDPLKKDDIIKRKSSENIDVSTIEELENFLNETFKVIDPKNELEIFRISLQSLRENILGRKLRISFIGNINVGKSSVLNCIIGKDILPTNEIECTYRGVIIRHKNIKKYKLYKTRLITRGNGLDQYYYFEIDQKPYCEGVNEIKSFLKNKNNDKKISDEDAFIVIEGKLKIFDYIKLDEKIINSIEFIDLPGLDRESNIFRENYYPKILRFSNSCIYINEPKSIDDIYSVDNMLKQYLSDKGKVLPNLRSQFIKTCLFLINKSDTINISDKKVRTNYKNAIFNKIKSIEENLNINDMNISFISAKKVNYFMEIYYLYVVKLEDSPFKILYKFFMEYHNTIFKFKDFKNHIFKSLSKIEEHFNLDLDDNEYEIPEQFKNKLKSSFNYLYKKSYIRLTKIEEDEIIQKLYSLNQQLKSKDFSQTIYSLSFFNILKKAIKNSENLQKTNLNNCILDFFSYSDDLFQKELQEENEKEKLNHKKRLENIQKELIPNANVFLDATEQNLKNHIEEGKNKCLNLIEDEINNISDKLKDANKNISTAKKNLEIKIEKIIENVRIKQKEEIEILINLLQELFEKKFKQYVEKEYSSSKIHTNRGLTSKMIISAAVSTISGVAIRTGLTMVGEAILAGGLGSTIASTSLGSAAAMVITGPVGIAIGFGVGLTISISTLFYNLLKKEKRYKKGLEKFKEDIEKLFKEAEKNCVEDFILYKNTFMKEIALRMSIINMNITSVDSKKWEAIKNNYNEKKNKIMKKIKPNEI